MTKRLDPPDTVDLAVHWLLKLQAEGWSLEELHHSIAYQEVGKNRLPYSATLTIKLIPKG